ncbi:MAG: AbrB/MazE/SpoVT family DNA-binding domain-containing protein [Methylococcaceae bacterium]
MSTAVITTKGQITIPKNVREVMHVQTGDRIEFVQVSEDKYEIIATSQDVKKLKGIVKSKVKQIVSIDQMNAAISTMGQ